MSEWWCALASIWPDSYLVDLVSRDKGFGRTGIQLDVNIQPDSADSGNSTPLTRSRVAIWFRAIRVHQWVKNVLVLVPALMAHRILESQVLLASVLAFVAFSLCASSVYVVNDLLDLAADRKHPRKRYRPFASGALSPGHGVWVAIGLVFASLLVAAMVNRWFLGTLIAYYLITIGYSLRLKRAAMVDVMALAGLYTLRIIAGSAATKIAPSFWLLAFSMFIFLSLALIKRYAELHDVRKAEEGVAHGRGYGSTDLELLMPMGVAAAFCSIVVLALYINSPESQVLYRTKEALWLICPLLLYWIMRMWLLAGRGHMNDDPVVFAIRDRISLATLGLTGGLVFMAL